MAVSDTIGNDRTAAMQTFATVAGSLDAGQSLPRHVALSKATPNPARNGTSFVAEVPSAARLRFQVFDLQGRVVWSDHDRDLEPGRWTLTWSARSANGMPFAPGLYFARAEIGGQRFTRRVIIVR